MLKNIKSSLTQSFLRLQSLHRHQRRGFRVIEQEHTTDGEQVDYPGGGGKEENGKKGSHGESMGTQCSEDGGFGMSS